MKILFLIILLIPFASIAREVVIPPALEKCRVVHHTPDTDVVYKPSVDTAGKRVVPAGLHDNSAILKQLENIDIPLELPIEDYIKSDAFNANLSNTSINPARLRVSKNEMYLDDVKIWPSEEEFDPECVKRVLDSLE